MRFKAHQEELIRQVIAEPFLGRRILGNLSYIRTVAKRLEERWNKRTEFYSSDSGMKKRWMTIDHCATGTIDKAWENCVTVLVCNPCEATE